MMNQLQISNPDYVGPCFSTIFWHHDLDFRNVSGRREGVSFQARGKRTSIILIYIISLNFIKSISLKHFNYNIIYNENKMIRQV